MNIKKNEIGLISRMIEVYERELHNVKISDYVKNGEFEILKELKEKINNDISKRRGTRGN